MWLTNNKYWRTDMLSWNRNRKQKTGIFWKQNRPGTFLSKVWNLHHQINQLQCWTCSFGIMKPLTSCTKTRHIPNFSGARWAYMWTYHLPNFFPGAKLGLSRSTRSSLLQVLVRWRRKISSSSVKLSVATACEAQIEPQISTAWKHLVDPEVCPACRLRNFLIIGLLAAAWLQPLKIWSLKVHWDHRRCILGLSNAIHLRERISHWANWRYLDFKIPMYVLVKILFGSCDCSLHWLIVAIISMSTLQNPTAGPRTIC